MSKKVSLLREKTAGNYGIKWVATKDKTKDRSFDKGQTLRALCSNVLWDRVGFKNKPTKDMGKKPFT